MTIVGGVTLLPSSLLLVLPASATSATTAALLVMAHINQIASHAHLASSSSSKMERVDSVNLVVRSSLPKKLKRIPLALFLLSLFRPQ